MSFAALLGKQHSFPTPELLEEDLIDSDLLALLGDELDGEGIVRAAMSNSDLGFALKVRPPTTVVCAKHAVPSFDGHPDSRDSIVAVGIDGHDMD